MYENNIFVFRGKCKRPERNGLVQSIWAFDWTEPENFNRARTISGFKMGTFKGQNDILNYNQTNVHYRSSCFKQDKFGKVGIYSKPK